MGYVARHGLVGNTKELLYNNAMKLKSLGHELESDEDYITMIESIELSAINSKIQIL